MWKEWEKCVTLWRNKDNEVTDQVQRIDAMEQRMLRLADAVQALERAREEYVRRMEDRKALEAYYGSAEWWGDRAADEAGLLPSDLRRGVLSEDGVWNLLEECRNIDSQVVVNQDAVSEDDNP